MFLLGTEGMVFARWQWVVGKDLQLFIILASLFQASAVSITTVEGNATAVWMRTSCLAWWRGNVQEIPSRGLL